MQTKEHPYAMLFPSNRVQVQNNEVEQVHAAIDFIGQFDPMTTEGQELEMILMHTAFIVNDHNEFVNNYNIERARNKRFIDHVDMVHGSDINIWCRQLYDFSFWRWDNFVTVNIIWNWLRGTLATPTSFL